MSHLQYHIETFGCQMNIYDSELVAGLLQKCGYSETEDLNQADIIFLNTCAIREKAEETVHHRLESMQYLKKQNPIPEPEKNDEEQIEKRNSEIEDELLKNDNLFVDTMANSLKFKKDEWKKILSTDVGIG